MSTATPGWPSKCSSGDWDSHFATTHSRLWGDNPRAAQKLADSFAKLDWIKILDRLAHRVNPLMKQGWFRRLSYYWVTDKAELATDLIFTSRECGGSLSAVARSCRGEFLSERHPEFPGKTIPPSVRWEVLRAARKDDGPGPRQRLARQIDHLGSSLALTMGADRRPAE